MLTRRFNYILIESSACVSLAFNITRYPSISRNKRSVKSSGQASRYCFAVKSVFPLGSRESLSGAWLKYYTLNDYTDKCNILLYIYKSFRILNECTLVTYTIILIFYLHLSFNRSIAFIHLIESLMKLCCHR